MSVSLVPNALGNLKLVQQFAADFSRSLVHSCNSEEIRRFTHRTAQGNFNMVSAVGPSVRFHLSHERIF